MDSNDQTAAAAAPKPAALRWPPQIKYIIGNEACERFSYYGIRSILALYISTVLFQHLPSGEAKDKATEIIHLFIFANYFTPLLGAWVSDKLWGRYNTILYVSLLYCVGNLTLAVTAADVATATAGAGSRWGLYIGLGLIALGSGGIKPCVSAFCGDQFRAEQSALLQKAYGLFYWSINFGSFFSFLVIPWLKNEWGYRIAFGVPGVLMLVATAIFFAGRKYYTRMPPSSQTKSAGFMRVTWFALSNFSRRQPGQKFWDVARAKFAEKDVDAASSVGPILAVFAPITIFWALFDQTSSTWVMQGSKMIPFKISGNFAIGAEQMQSMNPAFVMMLVPLTLFLYPRVEKLTGIRVSPLRRMGTGMVLASLAYVVVGLLQTRVDAGVQMSVLWQTIPYFVLTTAEVLISTTGLEFAFTQAAAEMKSTIMSFWLLTVAVGNLFVPVITKIQGAVLGGTAHGASAAVNSSTFYLYAGLTFAVAIIFVLVATSYKERKLELTSSQV
jgi:POT family proton-dependent oligopeptide transporter